MHTCISSHGLKRSWRSCPRRVNAGNKNTPSTHHPRRRNVTTLMVGLKKTVTYAKISPKSGEPQRYCWGTQKKKKKKGIHPSHQSLLLVVGGGGGVVGGGGAFHPLDSYFECLPARRQLQCFLLQWYTLQEWRQHPSIPHPLLLGVIGKWVAVVCWLPNVPETC